MNNNIEFDGMDNYLDLNEARPNRIRKIDRKLNKRKKKRERDVQERRKKGKNKRKDKYKMEDWD